MIPSFVDQEFVLKLVGIGAGLAWEYWLGKTDKVKAGSTLELLQNLVAGILKAFIPKKQ